MTRSSPTVKRPLDDVYRSLVEIHVENCSYCAERVKEREEIQRRCAAFAVALDGRGLRGLAGASSQSLHFQGGRREFGL